MSVSDSIIGGLSRHWFLYVGTEELLVLRGNMSEKIRRLKLYRKTQQRVNIKGAHTAVTGQVQTWLKV